MPRIAVGEWRPDVSDLKAEHTRVLRNVFPRSDGYGPVPSLETFSQSLSGLGRGAFLARRPTGEVAIFAGTATDLYLMNNASYSWVNVSKTGGYTSLGENRNWSFTQFGNLVIAVQGGTDPQVYNLISSSQFADLGGSPPRAGHCATVGPFVVLSDLSDNPLRIHWSGINNATQWTSGVERSDYQDLPDGGRPLYVAEMASDMALILQDEMVRRMIYQPGSSVIFRIDRLPAAPGLMAPYSPVVSRGGCYYLSNEGFVALSSDGSIAPIGEERVNRTILGQHRASVLPEIKDIAIDMSRLRLCCGAADPNRDLIWWFYPTSDAAENTFDAAMVFSTTLNRWSFVELSGRYALSSAKPGLTLEGLDAIAPGAVAVSNATNNGSGLVRITTAAAHGRSTGDWVTISDVGGVPGANGTRSITVISSTVFDLVGSTFSGAYTSGGLVAGDLDSIPFSLDSISVATLSELSIFGSTGALGFLTGPALEAQIGLMEEAVPPYRVLINGAWPVSDANDVRLTIEARDTLHNAAPNIGVEGSMNSDGYIALLDEGRYVRARARIPANTEWTYFSGIEPDVVMAGRL